MRSPSATCRRRATTSRPLHDGTLTDYQVHEVRASPGSPCGRSSGTSPRASSTRRRPSAARTCWRSGSCRGCSTGPSTETEDWLESKFSTKPEIADANVTALRAGWNYGDTTEAFAFTYEVKPAKLPRAATATSPATRRWPTGWWRPACAAGLPLFYGSYPITPASDILHELAKLKHFGVATYQAEDEIAAIGSVIGAAFGGNLAVTASSGPGIALKTEAMGLAVITELPLIVIDVQRGGPSTGLPTKTEQSDLLQVLFGRNGEAPMPVVAASSPADCFDAAIEAARIALTYRTPVVLLSDGYLANSAEPWRLPEVDDLPALSEVSPSRPSRTPRTAASPAVPARRGDARPPVGTAGDPGLEHRLGGIEKETDTGHISYDPGNHHAQTEMRYARLERIAAQLPPLEVVDPSPVRPRCWWSAGGRPRGRSRRPATILRARGRKVARVHLRHLSPLHPDLGDLLRSYRVVVCPENNMGQLAMLLRAGPWSTSRPTTASPGSRSDRAGRTRRGRIERFGLGRAEGAGMTTNDAS
jgi:2-oxoglutarate/2-oxoacid ferredoxin oxidoreductase subunit alpha